VTSPRSIDSGVSSRIARAIRVDDPVDVARNFVNRSANASRIRGSAAVAARSSIGSVGLIKRQPSRSRIAGRDEAGAQWADADPGAAGELEIFCNAAVEIEPGIEIVRICRLDRIAEFIKTFFVERRGGELRLPPITRRDVRSLGANLELAIGLNKLRIVAQHRKPDMARAAGERICRHEERRGFGSAKAGQHWHAKSGFLNAQFVETVPDKRRQRRTSEKHRL